MILLKLADLTRSGPLLHPISKKSASKMTGLASRDYHEFKGSHARSGFAIRDGGSAALLS